MRRTGLILFCVVLMLGASIEVKAEDDKAAMDQEIIRNLDFFRHLELLEAQPMLNGLEKVIDEAKSPEPEDGDGQGDERKKSQ